MRSLSIAVAAALLLAATTTHANTFSDDDRAAYHTVMMQYLHDVLDVTEVGSHADQDTSICFQIIDPALDHLSRHLIQSDDLFELSVKMKNLEDENLVLHTFWHSLIEAQVDAREVGIALKVLTKCTANPRFSNGQAAIEKAVNPVAAELGSFEIRLKEHFFPSHQ